MYSPFIACVAALSLCGCGTLSGSRYQHFAVSSFYQGNQVDGAECTIKNDKGEWTVVTQGSTEIQRSYGDIDITCVKDGFPDGHVILRSSSSGSWAGSLLGGAVSTAVDTLSESVFAYPSMVTVYMGETVTLPPSPKPTQN